MNKPIRQAVFSDNSFEHPRSEGRTPFSFVRTTLQKHLPELEADRIPCVRDAYASMRRSHTDIVLDHAPGFRVFMLQGMSAEGGLCIAFVKDDGLFGQFRISPSVGTRLLGEAGGDYEGVAWRLADLFRNAPAGRPVDEMAEVDWWLAPEHYSKANNQLLWTFIGAQHRAVVGASENALAAQLRDRIIAQARTAFDRPHDTDEATVVDGVALDTWGRLTPQQLEQDPEEFCQRFVIERRDVRRVVKVFEGIILSRERVRFRCRVGKLRKAIDKECLSIVSSLQACSPNMLNWLAGATWALEEGSHLVWKDCCVQRAARRQEFARNFRFFAEALVKSISQARRFGAECQTDPHALADAEINERQRVAACLRVLDAIDGGEEVTPILASAFNVSKATIRRMRSLTWQRTGRGLWRNAHSTALLLDAVPLEWWPVKRGEWQRFEAVTQHLKEFATLVGEEARDVLRACRGDWRRLWVRSNRDGEFASDVGDAYRMLTTRLLVPQIEAFARAEGLDGYMARDRATDIIAERVKPRDILGSRNLLEALRWQRAVHDIDLQLTTKAQTIGADRLDPVSWPVLLGRIPLDNGIEAVELHSRSMFETEGARQRHCVGGYTGKAVHGESIVFSIRKGEDILSTTEYSIEANRFRIVQNRAARNQLPCRQADAAAKRIEKMLNRTDKNAQKNFYAGLEPAKEQYRLQQLAVARRSARYSVDQAREAFDLMRNLLASDCQNMTLEAWAWTMIGCDVGSPLPQTKRSKLAFKSHSISACETSDDPDLILF